MILEKLNKLVTTAEVEADRAASTKSMISYSQVALFNKCQHAWKLHYIDKVRFSNMSINTVFGTAMHVVIQTYLETLYNQSIIEADKLNLPELLYQTFVKEYARNKADNNNEHFSTKEELEEFYNDGVNILKEFKIDRKTSFNTKSMKLIGIEMPLYIQLDCNRNVCLLAYLDIVTYDSVDDMIKITDVKTSTKGWSKWTKADTSKTNQLLIYKKYLSKMYDIPLPNIDVEFYIVKRQLYDQSEWEQKRIQKFKPANGSVSMKKMNDYINFFVNHAFDSDGKYRLDVEYKKNIETHNCKFCEYKGTEYCPESADI